MTVPPQRRRPRLVRSGLAALVALTVLAGCTGDGPDSAPSPIPTSTSPPASTAPTAASPPSATASAEDLPALADPPPGDVSLWLDTIGIPVVAAVRTSTPLAGLAEQAPQDRLSTCRQVAADLDGIGAPEVLTGLAITADAETATLLVGDLRAKAELLATCAEGGAELDALIAEVERTHAVAVAWLAQLRGE